MISKKHLLVLNILLASCLLSCGKNDSQATASDVTMLSTENATAAANALEATSRQLSISNIADESSSEESKDISSASESNIGQSPTDETPIVDEEDIFVSDFTFGIKLIQGTTKSQQADKIYSSWDFDITTAMEPIPDDYISPDYLLYVSNSNRISADTYVGEMVPISQNFSTEKKIYTEDVVILERRAAQAAIAMLNDVNTLYPDTTIVPDSGYRSVADQQAVMDKYIRLEGEAAAKKRVATPGTSNHHTGLALDIAMWRDGQFIDDVDDTDPAIIWLHSHAHEYGFFLEMPKGYNFKYEPWHFRYVGVEYATQIHNSGLLFKEWLAFTRSA